MAETATGTNPKSEFGFPPHWVIYRYLCAAGKRHFHFLAVGVRGLAAQGASGHNFCAKDSRLYR